MISVEAMPFPAQSNSDIHNNCLSSICNGNCSNGTQTYSIEVATTEESKITLLEKSIEFLRSQHESMLKALHGEIEQLRKLNKALQFRLVMCCCATNKEASEKISDGCTTSGNDKEKQIEELRRLLKEEKQINASLQMRIETLKLAQNAITDGSRTIQNGLTKQKRENEHTHEHFKALNASQHSATENKNVTFQRPSQSAGHRLPEPTESSKLEKNSRANSVKHTHERRIVSPELNPESSSSAILLSPDTVIDTPDGFWVRPSVATLQNQSGARVSISPRGSRASGHILPVKLPVLRTAGSLNQVSVRDTSKDILTPKLHPASEEFPDAPEGEAPTKKYSNQSNEARYSRSSRSVRNIIKMYEAARNIGFPVTRTYTIHPDRSGHNSSYEPFLPAISRSAEVNHSGRMKKTRESQKKHSHRKSDYGLP